MPRVRGPGRFAVAPALHAQESPVLRVDIIQVDVDTDGDNTVDTTFTTPNESYGPANNKVTFTAQAEGTFTVNSFTYTFFVNGVTIGQSANPVLPPLTDSASWIPPRPGVYYLTVTATDSDTTVTSPAVRFYATGTRPKRVLVRAIGPTLATHGVSGALDDPFLQILKGSLSVRENNDWEMGNDVTAITEATQQVGAFPLSSGSADSALLITLPPGIYTAMVTSASGTNGIALVEIYEVE